MSEMTLEQVRDWHREMERHAPLHKKAADAIDAEIKRQASAQSEAIGEAGSMPGTGGFTMAVFRAADVPIGAKLYTAPPAAAVPNVDEMVRRFLSWRLPDDFRPDAGISFDRSFADRFPACWPTGTNLLNAEQAEKMVLHMLAAAPQPKVEG